MDKLKRLLKKTPPVPFGIAGALLFLLLFYTLAFRTPLWQVWMPPNIDNDEVIYNRQVVSVIAHGGPLGYFGYNEGTADIGRYGAWGPVLIWVYGLAGRLFGASVNTMFWCNVLFLALGVVVFTVAARLNIGQQILCYGGLGRLPLVAGARGTGLRAGDHLPPLRAFVLGVPAGGCLGR